MCTMFIHINIHITQTNEVEGKLCYDKNNYRCFCFSKMIYGFISVRNEYHFCSRQSTRTWEGRMKRLVFSNFAGSFRYEMMRHWLSDSSQQFQLTTLLYAK